MFLTREGSTGFTLLTPSGTAAPWWLAVLLGLVSQGLMLPELGAGVVPTARLPGCRRRRGSPSPSLLELLSCSHMAGWAFSASISRESCLWQLLSPPMGWTLPLPSGVPTAAPRWSQLRSLVAFEKSGMERCGG